MKERFRSNTSQSDVKGRFHPMVGAWELLTINTGKNAITFFSHLLICMVLIFLFRQGLLLQSVFVILAATSAFLLHPVYMLRPNLLTRYTANIYWKAFITISAFLLFFIGVRNEDLFVTLAGGYSLLTKLTYRYWKAVLT